MRSLDDIRATCHAATPGPWETYNPNEGSEYGPLWSVANDAFHNPTGDDEPWMAVNVDTGQREDADFIAKARTDMPEMVAEIERLREANANLIRHAEALADELVLAAGDDRLAEFVRWLVAMDDPDDHAALKDRQKVTLNQIIEKAREALGEQD